MSAIGDTHAAQTDERAAIARVATLVAMDAEPADVFAAVSREVHRLFELGPDPVEMAGVIRFEPGPMHIAVGLSRDLGAFSVGARWAPEEPCALSAVRRTGRSARIEEAAVAAAAGAHPSAHESGEVNRRITQLASPIVVNGELWGAISVKTLNDVPDDAEARLEKFAELTAMAITRLRTNPTLTEVVREQAALRRVAALVAGGVPFQAVFSAVCEEVGVLLDADAAALVAPADGAMSIVASWSSSEPFAKGGAPWPLTPGSVAARVIETGRPARSEGPVELDGWIGDVARRMGLQTTVGAPITVGGKLWGALVVSTRREAAWTDQTEHRLVAFTNLIAMAISNAESARQLEHVAAEQAALRRVATLVARGASSGEVADVVAAEVGTLLDSDSTIVVRCDGDGTVEAIATWSDNPAWVIPVGTSRPAGGHNAVTIVLETGKPTRTDDVSNASGAIAELGASHGFTAAIAAPITVAGRVWGVMLVVNQQLGRFPPGAETRLAEFTDLVATAIANADSQQALAILAAEQAALRRIATQVAHGLEPLQIFAAVTEEISAAIGSHISAVTLVRYDGPGPSVVLESASPGLKVKVGTRWELSQALGAAEVYRTGKSARFDTLDWSTYTGPVADIARRFGVACQVATPIMVDGSLWGAISVAGETRLPEDTEQRMARFTELVATAIANAESKYELAASRRRIVKASDEARRRIERNLHDGIQQGLIELTFRAQALARKDAVHGEAAELAERLGTMSEELREVSRGIHPTILSEAGLGPALRALARRSTVPAAVEVHIDHRLPDDIEAAAYYVASEALANVTKHSQASVVDIQARIDEDSLALRVRDNGIGGVDPSRGSGIHGIQDRVEALGGTVSICSPPGHGTELSVLLPTAAEANRLLGAEEGDHG